LNWDLLDWSIVGPALVAGLLVLSTHVPLGQVVLQRGIIFIDLAIAQVAALGVIAAISTPYRPWRSVRHWWLPPRSTGRSAGGPKFRRR
jgi:ABC-type Mn2+/Zn2+ transport system permease subunit